MVTVLAVEQAAVAAVLAVAAAMVKMMVAAVASMAVEVKSSAVCALHHITYVESWRALMMDSGYHIIRRCSQLLILRRAVGGYYRRRFLAMVLSIWLSLR